MDMADDAARIARETGWLPSGGDGRAAAVR